jgi:alpha-1,6-mannosyltransferase
MALSLVVVCGGAIAIAGGERQASHGLPVWVTGLLASLALHLTAAEFWLGLLLMSAGYLGVLVFGGSLGARWVLAAIVGLHVAFALSPPLFSADVFAYIADARLAVVHGLDPYSATPAAFPHDPVHRFVAQPELHSPYGPLFTVASYPLAALGPAVALWAFKAMAAAASLGCVALVWKIAKGTDRIPLRAVTVFGLNPLLLVWAVGGAHNDLLMLLGMLAGVALILVSRETLGGVALGLAAGIKATAGLAVPFAVIGAQRRWRTVAGVSVAVLITVVVAVVAFPNHAFAYLDALRHQQQLISLASIPTQVTRLLGVPQGAPSVRLLCEGLFVIAAVSLVIRVWRGGNWLIASGWAFVALLATSTWFMVWYTAWPLAFAAITRNRRLLIATLALQAYQVIERIHLVT